MANLLLDRKALRRYSSHKARDLTKRTFIYIILVLMSIFWLFPFVYLIFQSFAKTYSHGSFFPKEWTLDNYAGLFTDTAYPFFRWFINTFLIALATAVLQSILVLMTSYALSRLRFKGRQAIMKMILILGMYPGFLGMVVIYYILQLIGLDQSIYSLIIIYVGSSAMGYYIAKGFFDTIPKSLDEAVLIDGGTKNTVFWKVIMPLSKPIIIYTVLMSFTAPWGDYMLAAYLAQGKAPMFNVAVGLRQMLTKDNIDIYFPRFCAGAVITSIPITVLFFSMQRYYVEGIAGGAVKG